MKPFPTPTSIQPGLQSCASFSGAPLGSLSICHLFYHLACDLICSISRVWFKYVSSIFRQNGQWVLADTLDVHFIATCFNASFKSAYNTENLFSVYLKEVADKHFSINQTWGGSQGSSNRPKHNLSRFTLHQTTTQLSLKTVTVVSFTFGHQKNQAQNSCCLDQIFTSHRGIGVSKKLQILSHWPGSVHCYEKHLK